MFTLQMVLGYEMQSQALEMGITKHPTLLQYFNEDMILLQFLTSEYRNNLLYNLSPFFERKLFLTVELCKCRF